MTGDCLMALQPACHPTLVTKLPQPCLDRVVDCSPSLPSSPTCLLLPLCPLFPRPDPGSHDSPLYLDPVLYPPHSRALLISKEEAKPLWLILLRVPPFVPAFTEGKLARGVTQCHLDDTLVGLQQLTHAQNPLLSDKTQIKEDAREPRHLLPPSILS